MIAPKRILIFALTYHPFVGGAEVALKEITDRLSSDEFHFDMITLRFDRNLPKVERLGNVTVHRIGFAVRGAKISDRSMPLVCRIAKALFPFTSFLKALRLQAKTPYDLVWIMMANQGAFGALFFGWIYAEIPFLLELQDGRAFADMKKRRPILRPLWFLYQRVYRRADVIKCISHFIAKEVRAIGYRGRVVVIPNGVDVARFAEPISKEDAQKLRARFNLHEKDIVLFTASRLVLSRGVEDVIQALAGLPRFVKFLIAGEGEDRGKLEHIARGLAVRHRVIFAGHLSHQELPALLHVADIFVRPSLIEGMGNAFIEAFAAGVPVIGTPVGGIPDFLFDPERNPKQPSTGLFCEVRDPGSILKAVERYLQDPTLRDRVVENASALVREKYDWQFIAHDMKEKVFDRI